MLYKEKHKAVNRIPSLDKFEGNKYFEAFKKKMLTKSIPSCTVARALYILQIQLNTVIHYKVSL